MVFFVVVSILCMISLNVSFKGGDVPTEEAGARLPQEHHYWQLQLWHPQEALHRAGSHRASANPAPGEDAPVHTTAHSIAKLASRQQILD